MGVFDEIRRSLERIIGRGGSLDAQTLLQEETYIRKFIAGLVYCHGQRRTYYALTFEPNSIDREPELLSAIEAETREGCSELRDAFGYSEEEVFNPPFEYPDIEVGQE